MNLTGPHGLEIRLMPYPLLNEADYIKVHRGAALILLGRKWLLHSANRVRRRPGSLAQVIDLPTPRGAGRFKEID